ncbi:unnamed protein product [Blepharisma stoltei]|uniref:C3H1-type domain-containing protein n=1 Tax=Blepharisma stoltei TaxID=1481888 RepID=A0AAU9JVD6_9CILI|nr:unnamed protein product [Blepharisma stoltei]
MSWHTDFLQPAFLPYDATLNFLEESLMSYGVLKELSPKKTDNDFKIKYKTERCKNWEAGICEFGSRCAFAHGDSELRLRGHATKNYKTKKCKQFFELGYCIYGYRCQFKHRDNSPDIDAKCSRNGFIENMPGNKRLSIFKQLENRGN